MPDPQISLSTVHELEYRMIDLLDKIRSDVVDLLQPDQRNNSLAADLSVALGTLKVVAETACQLIRKGKSTSETNKINAETAKNNSERAKIFHSQTHHR